MNFSVEHTIQVWNDETGERVEISPDRDGLGLVLISFVGDDGKRRDSISMPPEQATLVARAILNLYDTSGS